MNSWTKNIILENASFFSISLRSNFSWNQKGGIR